MKKRFGGYAKPKPIQFIEWFKMKTLKGGTTPLVEAAQFQEETEN